MIKFDEISFECATGISNLGSHHHNNNKNDDDGDDTKTQ